MKTVSTLLLLFSFMASFGQTWLQYNHVPNTTTAYVDCGNVKVPGTQLTVECLVTGGGRYISKHSHAGNVNYTLSNQQFEITTSNGYYIVPFSENNCSYRHIAATYDGAFVRVYVDGNLVQTQAVTGNMATTDEIPLRIGQIAAGGGIFNEQGTGYIDEVRIWNVVRTQGQIQANMSRSLASDDRSGLLAYYRFNSLMNLAPTGAVYNGTAYNCTLGATLPAFTTTWTGAVNTTWFNCGNWSNGVPYCPTGTAIIPNTTNKPAITTPDASARTVTVEPGGRIDNNGGRLTVCQ